MRLPIALAALAAGLALAAPASAATFQLTDQGESPDVAVDEAGTGHFVWNEPGTSIDGADVIRYCQVPAGGTACQVIHNLVPSLPDYNFDGLGRSPRVHVRGEEVLVTTHRADDRTWIFLSTDGGQTFSTGRPVMSRPYSNPSDAVRGPGDLLFQVYGSTFQAASVYADAPETAFADLGAGVASPTSATVGLLNPGTPIVAFNSSAYGEVPRLYFRHYTGSGSYNDPANWTPAAQIGEGSEALVRSGPSGIYLYHRSTGSQPRYVLRKWTGTAFGPPKTIEEGDAGFPEAGDLAVDPGGGVHTLWGQEQSAITYRRSLDGGANFSNPAPVGVGQDVLYHPRMAFNSKHAGYVVWDSNTKGVVGAEPIGASGVQPPAKPPPGACAVVNFEVVEAIISNGCFTKEGDAFVARGVAVGVNGLTLAPSSNGTRIRIDPAAKRITSDGVVVTKLGTLPIDVGKVSWQFSGKDRERITGLEAEDAGGKNSFFGFPIKGEAFVDFLSKRSEVVLNVGLPSVFGGLRGQGVVRADNQAGVRFDGLTIRIGDARLGALQVKDLVLQYVVGGNFSGAAQLILPPNPPGAKITGSFSFKNGKFAHAEGDYRPPLPVPIGGPIAMTHLGFGLFLDPPPTKITAQIGLVAGPTIAGKAALGIEATGFFKFPQPPTPAHLHIEGSAKLANQFELAAASLDYFSNGLIKFAAKLDKPLFGGVVRPKIQIGGFIDFGSSRFSFDGNGTACFIKDDWCPANASATLSSKGIAACGKITVLPLIPSMGIAYRWGDAIWSAFKFYGCDAEEYRETPPPSPAQAAQAGTQFTVRRGAPTLSVAVRGSGGAPKVNLIGPNGRIVISSSPSQTVTSSSTANLVEVGPHAATYIGVKRPPAGRWRVAPQAGSPAIAEAKFAGGIPQPRVSARVRGSGRKRTLSYTVRRIPGQSVSFAERSGSVARVIGRAKRGRGKFRFRPGDGRAGKRTIEAIVEQDGLLRERKKLATYRAPGPERPGKPRLRLRRRGTTAIVSWRGVRNAARYDARITVDDGRRQLVFLGRKARRIKVPRIDRRTRATIAITALDRQLRKGRTARVEIRRR